MDESAVLDDTAPDELGAAEAALEAVEEGEAAPDESAELGDTAPDELGAAEGALEAVEEGEAADEVEAGDGAPVDAGEFKGTDRFGSRSTCHVCSSLSAA